MTENEGPSRLDRPRPGATDPRAAAWEDADDGARGRDRGAQLGGRSGGAGGVGGAGAGTGAPAGGGTFGP